MRNSARWIACLMLAMFGATVMPVPAQVFTTLANFDGTNGEVPQAPLAQGPDGNLYGTTTAGGPHGGGTLFNITPEGTLSTLFGFSICICGEGYYPDGGLLLTVERDFYGTASSGGANGLGTVFTYSGGTVTTVYSFCSQPNCTDGDDVAAGLTQATDGDFYGTTGFGGNIDCEYPNGCGTVFRVTAGGALRTLHTFELVDGDEPRGTLLQATDGNFYGTTSFGGNHLFGHINLLGTVFRITAAGKLTTLYNFGGPDGDSPFGGLTQGTDGNFYGTTSFGGDPTCNAPHGCGTVFRITPTGTLTTLHRFEMTDGALPAGGLIQATNGNFYGTTNGGYLCGAACGTVFMITPGGSLTTLHNFNGADGSEPNGGLVQATSGVFYGTTGSGGTNGSGTVFSLSTGLEPFVALVRSSGKIGQTGGILGQGFTGTTSVSLNGTPAAFTVASDTYITATIPPGATTGYVTVTTPSGTLTSNVRFRVLR